MELRSGSARQIWPKVSPLGVAVKWWLSGIIFIHRSRRTHNWGSFSNFVPSLWSLQSGSFRAALQPGPKGMAAKRKIQEEILATFLASEVRQHHFCCILLNLPIFKGRGICFSLEVFQDEIYPSYLFHTFHLPILLFCSVWVGSVYWFTNLLFSAISIFLFSPSTEFFLMLIFLFSRSPKCLLRRFNNFTGFFKNITFILQRFIGPLNSVFFGFCSSVC